MKLETLKQRLRRQRRPPIHEVRPSLNMDELLARHDAQMRRNAFWWEIKACAGIIALGLAIAWWVA